MIEFIGILIHGGAGQTGDGDGVRNPFIKQDLLRDGGRSIMAEELDLKEISFDECVDSIALVFRELISFSRDSERHLALLEIEIHWSKNGHQCKIKGRRIKSAVFSRDVLIKVAFSHSIDVEDGGRDLRSDFHGDLSVG